ncbi:MAG: bifunctional glutamate N-acetyltransferase/amino-acid acetyltransferase ArgJ [Actinobacteria bacterium]|nr:bifunctional glutamate N-acetyltransferase/amino-acid acetyltransferase ArgJ [Actinomycetota bacterium]
MISFPQGFHGIAVSAGLKSSGDLDLTLIVNSGSIKYGTAVFTDNRIEAAPVTWSREVVRDHQVAAVLLNSGGANACTGPVGFSHVHKSAEMVANHLNISASDVAICSTGLIGVQLPENKLFPALEKLLLEMKDGSILSSVENVARAIMTTDSVPKISSSTKGDLRTVGIAKGAGMLAPGLATMLSVIMTDGIVDPKTADEIFKKVSQSTFNRIDSDGCMSTNDTVLFLASGESGVAVNDEELEIMLTSICQDLAYQLISDAEGHSKVVHIRTIGAASESDAVTIGRSCARNNLLKCAINGEDPNWGRILAAIGTTNAIFDPYAIDVSINGIKVCHQSAPGEPIEQVVMKNKIVELLIDLKSGPHEATIYTNDLSAAYVHENSAYST